MNLESIQSNWNQAGAAPKSREELQRITRLRKHPLVNRIRIQFVIEALLLIAFVVVYYDAFDGHTKPLWTNGLLVAAGLAYIFTRYLGWRLLRNPVQGSDLKTSMNNFHRQLKRMARSVLISSFLFGSSVIIFFTSGITFTAEKYLLLAGMIITLVIFAYRVGRVWRERIRWIGQVMGEI